jgi:trans-2,3-dihydro-3-hydroxyanthranilate isomerase
MEHPFAGHPTIGSALLLAEKDALTELTLHEKVGPVALTIERSGNVPAIARLAVPVEPQEQPVTAALDEIAAMVSLKPAQIETGDLAPRAMSCGVPFLFIRVKDREALRAARLQKDKWQRLIADSWAPHVYVFALEPSEGDQSDIGARMFAPLMGIDEDPATGGAAAALAGVLAAQEPGRSGEAKWIIAQGVEMGRPSTLELRAKLQHGRASGIRVGGSAVRMGRGSLDLALMEQQR